MTNSEFFQDRNNINQIENLPPINFNDIYSSFIKEKQNIKISYLNIDELIKVNNFPIKENKFEFHPNDIKLIKQNQGICLVILVKEYTNKQINPINFLQTIPNLIFYEIFYSNKKMSAVTSGLGQYGKNQLIYNNDFGFEHSIRLFLIYNKVYNLPKRLNPNYNQLDMCKNCNECVKNCPAHAIHGDDYPNWLDEDACRDFYAFGDHDRIVSTKYGINLFLGNKFTDEQLKQVQTQEDFMELFGFENTETQVNKDGKTYQLEITYCRECINQIPCRKVEYKYNKNYCRILSEKPYDPNAIY